MLSNVHTVLAVHIIHTVLITQPVPKTGRSRPPGMCTSSLHCPHSRSAESRVDLGWDGVGLGWDGVWDGVGLGGMGWNVEWGGSDRA